MSKKIILFIFISLIILLGVSVYFNSLECTFLWDDEVFLKDNIYIKNWHGIKKIFLEDIGRGGIKEYGFYRPLQMLTYMIDYSFWKLNVKGYHLTNILLHILVALSIFWMLKFLCNDILTPFFTSALFVVHPIHTEAITYISGRADPLAGLFIILSFIFYIKSLSLPSIGAYMIMYMSYLFALLSKEYSLILPLLFVMYHFVFKKAIKTKQFLSILAISFFYILLRSVILKFPLSPITPHGTVFQRIPGVFVALSKYIRLLFLPFGLHMEYGYCLFKLFHPKAILGYAILITLLFLAFKKKNSNTIVSFSIFWFFVMLFPQSNIYPINAYMSEHWLYLPSIGLFLMVANVLTNLYRIESLKIFTIVFFVVLLIFYSFLTIIQNNYWKHPLVFYERNLKFAPNSPKLLNNLALLYKRSGDYEKAISLYKRAIENNPNYVEAYNNLGVLYTTTGWFDDAISSYKKAIEINPVYVKAYNNLGITYRKIGKYKEAIALFKKAIELNPDYAKAYNNLGDIYKEMGNLEEATVFYKKAKGLSGGVKR